MNRLYSIDKNLRKVEYALALLSGIITVILMLIVTLDVLLRNLFNKAFPGSYELVILLFLGIVFLAIPFVQSVKGHISIDIVTSSLPKFIQRTLDILALIASLAITVIIAWQTGIEFWKSFVSNDYTMGLVEYPIWPAKLSIAIGMGFLTLRLLIDFLLSIIDETYLEEDE